MFFDVGDEVVCVYNGVVLGKGVIVNRLDSSAKYPYQVEYTDSTGAKRDSRFWFHELKRVQLCTRFYGAPGKPASITYDNLLAKTSRCAMARICTPGGTTWM